MDTHILLWSQLAPSKLSPRVTEALADETSEWWLSPISVWECMLLAQRGRVALQPNPEGWLRTVIAQLALREATVNHEVAMHSRKVDLDYEDPADRFLVATASVYDLVLVTADERLIGRQGFSVLAN